MSHRTNLQMNISKRFNKSYSSASFPLQKLAEGKIRDFVNLQRSEPKTLLQHYGRLTQLLPGPVIEIKLSGGHRLLAQYSEDRLLLLDMGGHEVVGRYDIKKLENDLQKNEQAPQQFWPENKSKFFVRYPVDIPSNKYEEEVSPEWLYFLDNEQYAVYQQIALSVINAEHQPHFIIGGPGTGKTCIILNLLKYFVDDDYKVGIVISDYLRAYIENATHADISQYCVGLYNYPPLDLLLVDDPENIREILKTSDDNKVNTIVAAFDPLQLPYDFTDRKLEGVSSDFVVCRHELRTCYRQKENVGKSTKHIVEIVEASTPFLRQDKIDKFRQSREHLSRLSNDLTFVNPHGYAEDYPESTVNDVKAEINRILKGERLMWKHGPGLLILLDGYDLSEEDNAALEPLMQRKYVKILRFDQIEEVKGLEFQHVFIFIDKKLYEELQNGFKGSGQKEYHRRRMYRIPFSRAKDSLVTFAIESDV